VDALVAVFAEAWDLVVAGLVVVLAAVASGHAILHKRDTRAAVLWTTLIWFAPVVGATLYFVFGINRVRPRVAERRAFRAPLHASGELPVPLREVPRGWVEPPHLNPLATLVGRVARRPLTEGNAITPLLNGDNAYPLMVAAIDGATTSVGLSTYIFDNDAAGRLFQDALERAHRRGVAVRVLIDDVGSRYSLHPTATVLARRGVPVARFGQTMLPWRWAYFNLRNHRKLLVVDGRVGFTGGMNIREACLLQRHPPRPVQDLHFRLDGPVVSHLTDTFVDDWAFATREILSGPAWNAPVAAAGSTAARGISDGPDEDFENAEQTLMGAVACAQSSITIVTPYFLPERALITGLQVAALRGVAVTILLPEKNNQLLVHWASRAQLWQVLQRGCRVWYQPPPFDHSKLMIVDGAWALFGSTNWDARSLRLNWEFDVECYGRETVGRLAEIVQHKLARAQPVTLAQMDRRPLPVKLRDGVARLLSPYL
jgi:cardiolipin synthase